MDELKEAIKDLDSRSNYNSGGNTNNWGGGDPENVSIGDNCTIGFRSTIFCHLYWGTRKKHNEAKVVIEKDAYIGPHCVILPNVRIGEGSVIKAGTVVTRNVPPHTYWGIPQAEGLARVTVPLTNEHSYEEFVRGIKPIKKQRKKETGP